MNSVGDLLVGLVVLVGLFGVVVQVLPGGLLVAGAIIVWGVVTGGAAGWTVVAITVVVTVLAGIGKYLLAGRHLKRAGVPSSTLIWGGIAGVVGFFAIPVVGLFVGFVLGIYLAEWVRSRERAPRLAGHRGGAAGHGPDHPRGARRGPRVHRCVADGDWR